MSIFHQRSQHILNKGKFIEELAVADPISFIREVYSCYRRLGTVILFTFSFGAIYDMSCDYA